MKLFILLLLPLTVMADDLNEADYVKKHCKGKIEHVLFDGTRVDCLTDTHAIEYDFCYKWAESIGQSRYYAEITGKAQAIVLICASNEDRFVYRAKIACPQCQVEIVPNISP